MAVPIASAEDFERVIAYARAACGRLALNMGLNKLAVDNLSKAVKLLPGDAGLVVELARAVGPDHGGSTAAEVEILLQAVCQREEQSDYRIWAQLADSYYILQRPGDALQAVSRAIALLDAEDAAGTTAGAGGSVTGAAPDPNRARVWALQGRILLLMMDADAKVSLDELVPYFVRAVQTTSASRDLCCEIEARVSLAQLYYRFACYPQSHAELAQILVLADTHFARGASLTNPVTLSKLAYIFQFMCVVQYKMGNQAASVKLCLEALQMLPPCAKTFRLLAILAIFYIVEENTVQLRNIIPALIAEGKVLPDTEVTSLFIVNWLLGRIFDLLNDSRQSYEYYQIAMNLMPTAPTLWIAIGSLYLRVGQPQDAVIAFSRSISLATDESSNNTRFITRFHMLFAAFAYVGMSQAHLAISQFQNALGDLRQAISLFLSQNDTTHARQTERIYNILANSAQQSHEYIIPNLPAEIFLEVYLYWDSPVFTSTPNPYDTYTQPPRENRRVISGTSLSRSNPVAPCLPSVAPLPSFTNAREDTNPTDVSQQQQQPPSSLPSNYISASHIKTQTQPFVGSPENSVPTPLGMPPRYGTYSQIAPMPQSMMHPMHKAQHLVGVSPVIMNGVSAYPGSMNGNYPRVQGMNAMQSNHGPGHPGPGQFPIIPHNGQSMMIPAAAFHSRDVSR